MVIPCQEFYFYQFSKQMKTKTKPNNTFLLTSEAISKPCQTSKVEHCAHW